MTRNGIDHPQLFDGMRPPTPEQYETGARVFLSALQVAERMGVPKARAHAFASQQSARATGIDWARELKACHLGRDEGRTIASPTAHLHSHRSEVDSFLDLWRVGELGIPFNQPTLSLDLYQAFSAWQAKRGSVPLTIHVVAQRLIASGLLTRRRCRWADEGKVEGPATFLVPTNSWKPAGHVDAWLGACVRAFRSAMLKAGFS